MKRNLDLNLISKKVLKLFNGLDHETQNLKISSGIDCPDNCGACCYNPDIEATVLEFIPLALKLYQKGEIQIAYQKLENIRDNEICIFFAPGSSDTGSGRCSLYGQRGLICRVFGFSAFKDKNGNPVFTTCRVLKDLFPAAVDKLIKRSSSRPKIPVMTAYRSALSDICPPLADKSYPINIAVKLAIEKVLFFMKFTGKAA